MDRRERRAERARQDILEAAARAFAASPNATMQDIAREAGYTVPTLYSYFEGKAALAAALHEMLAREIMECFEIGFARGSTLAQRLEMLARAIFELADKRRAAYSVLFMLREHLCRNEADSLGAFHLAHARLKRWLSENATEDELAHHSPDAAATFLIGVGIAFLMHWMAFGHEERLADKAAHYVDLVLHGLAGSRAT